MAKTNSQNKTQEKTLQTTQVRLPIPLLDDLKDFAQTFPQIKNLSRQKLIRNILKFFMTYYKGEDLEPDS